MLNKDETVDQLISEQVAEARERIEKHIHGLSPEEQQTIINGTGKGPRLTVEEFINLAVNSYAHTMRLTVEEFGQRGLLDVEH